MKTKNAKKSIVKKPANTVLCLRTCKKDGSSQKGFKWPLTVGAVVTAPDFEATQECGHGLHGLLWGAGDSILVSQAKDDVGMVVEVLASEVVDLTDKVKFPRCTIRFVGTLQEAASFLAAETGRTVHFAQVTAGDNGQATAGNNGQATAGDYGQATAGDGGKAIAGDRGQATAGYNGEIHICYYDGARYRTAVGYVGEDGIKPNVAYEVVSGKLVEA